MYNYLNIFHPSCRVWISLSHRPSDIFSWVNICWDMLISISHYSDLVSWWSQNSKKMTLAPYRWRITTLFFFHLVEYRYSCPIEPMIFIWVNIGQDMLIYISYYSDLVSWWSQIVGKWLKLHKYEGLPPFFTHLIVYGCSFPIEHMKNIGT